MNVCTRFEIFDKNLLRCCVHEERMKSQKRYVEMWKYHKNLNRSSPHCRIRSNNVTIHHRLRSGCEQEDSNVIINKLVCFSISDRERHRTPSRGMQQLLRPSPHAWPRVRRWFLRSTQPDPQQNRRREKTDGARWSTRSGSALIL